MQHNDSVARPATPPSRGMDGARRLPFYSGREVADHNVASDCWVSYFGKVYDLTPLVQENKGLLVQPILKFAGQDISHWFDPKTKEPKTSIDPSSGLRRVHTPFGRFLHVPPPEPTTDWDSGFHTPWWEDEERFQVGFLSKQSRQIRILNLLTGQADLLNVCAEDTLNDIQERYLTFNKHAKSYTWKRLGKVLDMSRTLEENGIADESKEFEQLNMDVDQYIPTLHVHFNDDLTVG